MDKELVGKFIKKLREEKNMTQEELAKKLYCTRSNLSHIELGIVEISHDKVRLLAKIFGVSELDIYAGKCLSESLNEETKETFNNVIKETNLKFKRRLILFTVIFVLVIILFLLYYFFNSYNSVKLYKVYGENDYIKTSEGLFLLTKDNIYFNLSVTSNEGNSFDKVSLRYKFGNDDNLIYSSNSSDIFLVDFYGYEAYFNYDDIIKEKGTFYIEVENDNVKETLNLNIDKMYENKKIIFKKVKKITTGEKSNFKEIPVPEKIEKDFTKDGDENYYLTLDEKENVITMFYDSSLKQFIVGEDNKKTKENKVWIYYLEQKVLDYSYTEKSKVVDELSIDIVNMNQKETEIYEQFREKYIVKYLE